MRRLAGSGCGGMSSSMSMSNGSSSSSAQMMRLSQRAHQHCLQACNWPTAGLCDQAPHQQATGAPHSLPAVRSGSPAHLAHGQSVAADDGGGVDLLPHQLVGAAQQLRRHDDDAGGAVPHLLVLQLSQLHQDLAVVVGWGGRARCGWVMQPSEEGQKCKTSRPSWTGSGHAWRPNRTRAGSAAGGRGSRVSSMALLAAAAVGWSNAAAPPAAAQTGLYRRNGIAAAAGMPSRRPHLGGGVLHLQQLEDRGAVIGDRHIADVVHQHLLGGRGQPERGRWNGMLPGGRQSGLWQPHGAPCPGPRAPGWSSGCLPPPAPPWRSACAHPGRWCARRAAAAAVRPPQPLLMRRGAAVALLSSQARELNWQWQGGPIQQRQGKWLGARAMRSGRSLALVDMPARMGAVETTTTRIGPGCRSIASCIISARPSIERLAPCRSRPVRLPAASGPWQPPRHSSTFIALSSTIGARGTAAQCSQPPVLLYARRRQPPWHHCARLKTPEEQRS